MLLKAHEIDESAAVRVRYRAGGETRYFQLSEAELATIRKHAPATHAALCDESLDEYGRNVAAARAAKIDAATLQMRAQDQGEKFSRSGLDAIQMLNQLQNACERALEGQDELDRLAREAVIPAASSGWVDSSGRPVAVLAPNERLSRTRASDVELGEYIRALVLGSRDERIRAALSEGSQSAGGALVPAPLATDVIDRLRARSVVITAGARTVPMSSQTLAIARVVTDPTVSWAAEAAPLSDTGPTFDRVTLTAKTLRAWVKVSREVLEDAANLGQVVRDVFARTMATELDRAALVGSGSGAEPRGIGAATGAAPIIEMGPNGAALEDYDKLVDCYRTMLDANANEPNAMVMAPRTAAEIAKLTDTTGQPLQPPAILQNVRSLYTTSMPVNQTQGTATNASSVIMGDWSQLMIGVRSELQVVVGNGAFLDTNQVGLLFVMRADVAWTHAESFVQLRGIIPAA